MNIKNLGQTTTAYIYKARRILTALGSFRGRLVQLLKNSKCVFIQKIQNCFRFINHCGMIRNKSFTKIKNDWLHKKLSEINLINDSGNYQNLEELKWLIGEWKAESHLHGKLYSNYSLNENKTYITFNFTIFPVQGSKIEGIEIIYWNKNKQAICSQCLNSSGGESPEELWKREGNNWMLLEKNSSSSFVLYTPLPDGSFFWEKKARKESGEIISTIDPIRNYRINALAVQNISS